MAARRLEARGRRKEAEQDGLTGAWVFILIALTLIRHDIYLGYLFFFFFLLFFPPNN